MKLVVFVMDDDKKKRSLGVGNRPRVGHCDSFASDGTVTVSGNDRDSWVLTMER